MASTTLGVKVDDLLRSRLKDAATRLERTPHWLIKQAIFAYLERIEHGQLSPELTGANGSSELADVASAESDEDGAPTRSSILRRTCSRSPCCARPSRRRIAGRSLSACRS